MKLLIIDDHEVVRKGLKGALEIERIFNEVEEAENIEEALKILRISKPEIAIVDICLGRKQNGFEIIEKSQAEHLGTKFLVLTSSSRRDDFVKAKELDVSGYVLKDSNIEDIAYALKCLLKGKRFYDATLQIQQEKSSHKEVKEILTQREYEVLRALGKGYTNQQIAEQLYITENTVKKHISSVLAKLQLSNRIEAALYATKIWRRYED